MKKTIILLLCLMLILPMALSSCKKDGDMGEQSDSEQTTVATTEYDYSKIPDVIEPHERKLIASSELGLLAYFTGTEKYYVADAKVEENGDITLTSYNPGTTVITVKNSYGEEMSLTVTVGLDYDFESIDIRKFEMPDNYVYATNYGMNPERSDNAKYLQAAIDSLKTGGVVYIPKGNYYSTFVRLKSNVKLRLEGILPEYNTEFTDELSAAIESGNTFARIIAVNGDMFANHEKGGYGRYGADNFEITGGVLDMAGKSRCFIWCCAENVLLENVIMTDCMNDHAIQVTGCKNVTIRNVMFAGYNAGSNTSGAELIQIETSHPGAIGTGTVTASKFDEYEFYSCENVAIENCYFGKSDRYDSATYFIGHHVHNSGPSVRGLKIMDCTFDNPRIVAIRAYAFTDVEIADCVFLSDESNSVVSEARYMIELTFNTGHVKLPSGAYLSTAEDRGGTQNLRIHDNEFTIGDDSSMAGFIKTLRSGITQYDAMGYSNISETDFYTETPKSFTGYKLVTTRISDIYLHNNSFTVSNGADDNLFYLKDVRGVEFKGNTFDIDGVEILGDDYYGAYLEGSTMAEECRKNFVIKATSANRDTPIVLVSAAGNIEAYCTASSTGSYYNLIVSCEEGGVIERRTDKNGVLYVEAVADEGYKFVGYRADGQMIEAENFAFSTTTEIEAIFEKK
ncbi:MAG: hypothetical protein J6A83_04510 [Clostridia bacterium]|nr:hypothetical protein [Clostridia bacterium]